MRRLLVLAVDIDDDLSRAGIAAPLLGRREVLEAATRFALYDPEDSDLNTLFAAVKLADELRSRGVDAVPAVVAGSERGGVEASMRIREQLSRLLGETGAEAVVVVSDGSEDETIIPVIASMVPVAGVKRVVVKQHRGVEETYVLLARYLRKALTEPRFARLFLGIPGVALMVFSALALLGMLREALLIGLMILGASMVVRGFELEDRLASMLTETPVTMIAYGISILSAALAVGLLASQIYGGVATPQELAAALRGFTSLMGFSMSIAVFGHIVSKLLAGGLRPGREALYVVLTLLAVMLMNRLADAVSEMMSLSVEDFLAALVKVNFALYTVAAVLAAGIAWRLARIVDAALAEEEEEVEPEASGRTSSPGQSTSGEPGTARQG